MEADEPLDLQAEIARAEAQATGGRAELQFAHQMGQVHKGFQDRGEEDAARIAGWEAELFHLRTVACDGPRRGENGPWFQPMALWRLEDGSEVAAPLYEEFSEEQLDYYASRLEECQIPALVARYADILWERRRDAQAARRAYGGHMATYAKLVDQPDELGATHEAYGTHLPRAAELAVLLSDTKRIGDCLAVVLKAARSIQTLRDCWLLPVFLVPPVPFAPQALVPRRADRDGAGGDVVVVGADCGVGGEEGRGRPHA